MEFTNAVNTLSSTSTSAKNCSGKRLLRALLISLGCFVLQCNQNVSGAPFGETYPSISGIAGNNLGQSSITSTNFANTSFNSLSVDQKNSQQQQPLPSISRLNFIYTADCSSSNYVSQAQCKTSPNTFGQVTYGVFVYQVSAFLSYRLDSDESYLDIYSDVYKTTVRANLTLVTQSSTSSQIVYAIDRAPFPFRYLAIDGFSNQLCGNQNNVFQSQTTTVQQEMSTTLDILFWHELPNLNSLTGTNGFPTTRTGTGIPFQ